MAFQLFPAAEVWEMILGGMTDSKDVLNAFRAFPELEAEGILKRKKHLWLFDQVIPHLAPFLLKKEILACRQVCTQWSWAVDSFLDNHPSKRAYEHGGSSIITGQLWIPDASSKANYHSTKNVVKLKRFLFKGPMNQFISDMALHHHHHPPPGRNPFVGRAIEIHNARYDQRANYSLAFWETSGRLLQNFGGHVWFFKTAVRCIKEDGRRLLECLSHLPNLKGLEFSLKGYLTHCDGAPYLELSQEQAAAPPALPHLETLSLEERLPNCVSQYFVRSYSTQIRRLNMDARNWEPLYSDLFPNLTELQLNFHNVPLPQEKVVGLLTTLNCPRLFRLKLFFELSTVSPQLDVNILFPLLTRFPQLSSFVLSRVDHSNTDCVLAPPSDANGAGATLTIPSLKSLVLTRNRRHTYGICYASLKRSFPALEYLKISAEGLDLEGLWEALPKLREVTLKKGTVEKSYRRDPRFWKAGGKAKKDPTSYPSLVLVVP